MRKDTEEEKKTAQLLVRRDGSYVDWMQEPEIAPDEPTFEIPARGIIIGMAIGIGLWLAVAWVLWVAFRGGL